MYIYITIYDRRIYDWFYKQFSKLTYEFHRRSKSDFANTFKGSGTRKFNSQNQILTLTRPCCFQRSCLDISQGIKFLYETHKLYLELCSIFCLEFFSRTSLNEKTLVLFFMITIYLGIQTVLQSKINL